MTRVIWIETLNQFIIDGTVNERRLAKLALALIVHPDRTEQILDSEASEILES